MGRELAKLTGKPLVDLDEEIVRAEAPPGQQPVPLVNPLCLEDQIGPIGVVDNVHNRQTHRQAPCGSG